MKKLLITFLVFLTSSLYSQGVGILFDNSGSMKQFYSSQTLEDGKQVVIDLVWQACHTYNVESFLIKKQVASKHGLNFLKIETDYSPSDTEQIAMRIQALLELCHSGSKGG